MPTVPPAANNWSSAHADALKTGLVGPNLLERATIAPLV